MGLYVKKLILCLLLLALSACSSSSSINYGGLGGILSKQGTEYNENVVYYPPPKPLEDRGSIFSNISTIPETKIALLIPLSGRYSKLGEGLLNAAQLAVFNLNEPNLILIPIDTKGTPYGAHDAAQQAISKGAKLILGPVFGASTKAISELATENNINVVSFSNDRSLAGSGVFAIGIRPEEQISRIVSFATNHGIEDFSALLPGNALGSATAKELRETVEQKDGSSVLKTEIYRTDRQGNAVKLDAHARSAYRAAITKKPKKDYDEELEAYNDNPIKYPRGLVIPEGGRRLNEVTEILEKQNFETEKIQLIGSALWYEDENLQKPILNYAIFAAPPKDKRENFERKYFETYNKSPNNIASLAYDAVALAITLARLSNGQDFSRKAITNPRGFSGIEGIFRLREDGLSERGLAIIQIKDGEFFTVAKSPSSFFRLRDEENMADNES